MLGSTSRRLQRERHLSKGRTALQDRKIDYLLLAGEDLSGC